MPGPPSLNRRSRTVREGIAAAGRGPSTMGPPLSSSTMKKAGHAKCCPRANKACACLSPPPRCDDDDDDDGGRRNEPFVCPSLPLRGQVKNRIEKPRRHLRPDPPSQYHMFVPTTMIIRLASVPVYSESNIICTMRPRARASPVRSFFFPCRVTWQQERHCPQPV